MESKILNIFDFDGTLFKSPAPNPALWDSSLIGKIKSTTDQSGLGWFQDIVTLSEPYVPAEPSLDWFVHEIKEKVLESMSNPSAITVLLTGRTVQYANILKRIVKSAGLEFDEYGIKPGPFVTTMGFKIDFIEKLVLKYEPYRITMWEDRPVHANKFKSILSQKFPYIKCEIISVESAETFLPLHLELQIIEILSKNSGNKLSYRETITFTAVFIDTESINLLKSQFPPIEGWDQYYHHMTICLGSIHSCSSLLPHKIVIGTEVTLKVTALGQDKRAYAVKVTGCPSINKVPHITMCVAPKLSAKYSNEIIDWIPISKPFTIKGNIMEQKKFIFEKIVKPPKVEKINYGKEISELTTKKGKEIIASVKLLTAWMEENDLQNCKENLPIIRKYIIDNFLD